LSERGSRRLRHLILAVLFVDIRPLFGPITGVEPASDPAARIDETAARTDETGGLLAGVQKRVFRAEKSVEPAQQLLGLCRVAPHKQPRRCGVLDNRREQGLDARDLEARENAKDFRPKVVRRRIVTSTAQDFSPDFVKTFEAPQLLQHQRQDVVVYVTLTKIVDHLMHTLANIFFFAANRFFFVLVLCSGVTW
jgi:hypothetical protein